MLISKGILNLIQRNMSIVNHIVLTLLCYTGMCMSTWGNFVYFYFAELVCINEDNVTIKFLLKK